MTAYRIVDEPRPRSAEHLIVNPIIILLAAILIPIVFRPPYFANYWLPLLWCLVNAWLLRSASWKRELLAIVLGVLGFFLLIFITVIFKDFGWFDDARRIWSYSRILQSALFFSVMYYIVLKQSNAYAIFRYIREQHT